MTMLYVVVVLTIFIVETCICIIEICICKIETYFKRKKKVSVATDDDNLRDYLFDLCKLVNCYALKCAALWAGLTGNPFDKIISLSNVSFGFEQLKFDSKETFHLYYRIFNF